MLSSRLGETSHGRFVMAEVSGEIDYHYSLVGLLQFECKFEGIVGRTVVYENDLEVGKNGTRDLNGALVKLRK